MHGSYPVGRMPRANKTYRFVFILLFPFGFFFQFSPYSVHIRMDLLESITLATGGYLSLDLFSCSYFFFVDMVEFFMVRNTHRTHATCI
jgi:hypothetical protein